MAAKTLLSATERAAREVINRHVREGLITRATGNQILKFALPFGVTITAECRKGGQSFQRMREIVNQRAAAANTPTSRVAADVYLAILAGMQVDVAAHLNDHQIDA